MLHHVPGVIESRRQGQVIHSWLLDLHGLQGNAEDSGEGRRTVQAAPAAGTDPGAADKG